ncbi:MAG: AraC family transcriptional regulator [Alphaproteobacteria bacterium]
MKWVVRAAALGGLPELIADLGGNADAILREAGVDMGLLASPERFMSPHPVYRALNLAAKRLGRPDLGLLWGAQTSMTLVGPLHIGQLHSRTAREAFDLADRYLHTQTSAVRLSLVPTSRPGREFRRVENLLPNKEDLAQLSQRQLVVLHRAAQEICGPAYRPTEIWFEHPRIAPMAAYVKAFGIEPQFECPMAGLVIESRLLDAATPNQNPQLREMAEAYLRSLSPPEISTFSAEVVGMIRILLRSADCTATDVAHALGAHERTLQRKLHSEGTTFEQLKDEVRRSWAERLLADPLAPLTQIALNLQYANSSVLARSCQRWFGMSPTSYRQHLMGSARATA